MALPDSALSIAADGIAEAVSSYFNALGLTVVVSVDTPMAASDRAKGAGAKDAVNLFFYRIAPTAFQADHTSGDPFFLRLFCLVTAFAAKVAGETNGDLKLLGEVIRLFHAEPVLDALPAAPVAGDTVYQLQAVMLAPNMEELNHIWTTQGSETPYRLSVAYEFALVPVEPTVRRLPGPPVTSARLQVDAGLDAARDVASTPHTPFSAEARGLPLKPSPPHPPLAADWIPELLIVSGGGLTNIVHVAPATPSLALAVAGRPGSKARLTLSWFDAAGAPVGAPSVVVRTAAARLDRPDAIAAQATALPATAVRLTIVAEAARPDGSAIPGALRSAAVEAIFDGAGP